MIILTFLQFIEIFAHFACYSLAPHGFMPWGVIIYIICIALLKQ